MLTLCILVDFQIHIGTLSMRLPIVYYQGHSNTFLNCDVFLSLKVVLILTNSEGSNEMQPCDAFSLGLHCLAKHPIRVSRIQKVTKDIFCSILINYAAGPRVMQ